MGKEKYIVYVEDDEDDVLVLQESLKAISSITVRPFPHGKVFLQFLQNIGDGDYPCLIVLERVMPELMALDTVALLQENPVHASIPTVVLTTSASNKETEACRAAGIPLFIKPSSFEGWQRMCIELIKYCA